MTGFATDAFTALELRHTWGEAVWTARDRATYEIRIGKIVEGLRRGYVLARDLGPRLRLVESPDRPADPLPHPGARGADQGVAR